MVAKWGGGIAGGIGIGVGGMMVAIVLDFGIKVERRDDRTRRLNKAWGLDESKCKIALEKRTNRTSRSKIDWSVSQSTVQEFAEEIEARRETKETRRESKER